MDRAAGWFAAWLVIGGCYALAVASILTIGIFLLPLAIVATVVVTRRAPARAAFGLVSGLGLPVLAIAYLNRGGPGDVCSTTATSRTCTGEWSPWPFLAVGLLLIVAGVVAFRRVPPRSRPTLSP